MAFSHIPLRRTIPAGVLAFLAQYVAASGLLSPHIEGVLRAATVEIGGGESAALPALVEPAIPTWKAVGWVVHAAHNAKLLVPLPERGATAAVNLVAQAGGWYRLLYLLPPVVLFGTAYLVARTSRTSGAQGEQFAGASIALGYLPCCIVGGFLFSVTTPPVAPDLLQSILYAGLGYPVVFGWFGGLAARRRSKRDTERPVREEKMH